jgi:hypothetical protein
MKTSRTQDIKLWTDPSGSGQDSVADYYEQGNETWFHKAERLSTSLAIIRFRSISVKRCVSRVLK